MKPPASLLRQLGSWLLCLLLGALFSVLRGQDSSWDLKNYHWYNPWALLHGHAIGSGDIAAAGLQSYFNPLPDLPYQWLGSHWLHTSPRLLAAFQGLWFGAFLWILWSLFRELARQQGRRCTVQDGLGFLISASGTMVISQAGLSSNEVMLACLVLLSLRLLLPLADGKHRPGPLLLAAGLCCGLAAGLKPTAIVYAPALALATALAAGAPRRGLAWTLQLTLAASAGFALSYGWWGWRLWQHTGNPIFPLFNQIFQSPLTTTSNLADQRFKPHSLGQWLLYPAYWLSHNKMRVTEPTFADARYLLGMLAALALAVRLRLNRRQGRPDLVSQRPAWMLLGFAGSAYVLWLLIYSILRYAIPIEALTGLLMLLAVQAWCHHTNDQRRWHGGWIMAALCLLCASATDYPGWGHSRYARDGFGVAPIDVPAGSTVLMLGQPLAYLAPFFTHADSLRFIGVTELTTQSEGHGLWTRTRAAIIHATGPLFVLQRDSSRVQAAWLAQRLPGLGSHDCQPIHSALELGRNGKDFADGLRLCRLSLSAQTGD